MASREELAELARALRGHLSLGRQPLRGGGSYVPAPIRPASLTLRDVRGDLGDCTRCKLHPHRTHLVFGVGSEKAKLLFVGEAPGRDEDLSGEPFVGRAGMLLTQMIEAMGLTREEVYITNIIKCRPPENRDPQPDEVASCEPFLAKQVQAIGPRLICALGRVAAQTMLKTDVPIYRLRKVVHLYKGIPLLPVYHPASVLRNPSQRKDLEEDFRLLRKEYLRVSGGDR